MNKILWTENKLLKTENNRLSIMTLDEINKACAFHKSFPQYEPTPLVQLKHMADMLGVGALFVKDESYRFGLHAFKVLGASFAMAKYIAQSLKKDISELPYEVLTGEALRTEFGQATFFTATDGNHGRAVAWAAQKLSQKSVVLMPKGSSSARFEHIANEGAQVTIENVNYDECVRMAAERAQETEHGVLVQDTAWEGYEEIPSWIMQGYGTLVHEAAEQLNAAGIERPTHIFIQAGVGTFAAAVQGYFKNLFPDNCPMTVIVEARAADCLYRSAAAADGTAHSVTGDMHTIMAGLACGEPNSIAWDILKNNAAYFVSAPDWVSARGMRMLAAPLKGDAPITSGESGAVTFGLLSAIMQHTDMKDLREALQLDKDSKVLCFSTEGAADPFMYKQIVWEGFYPSL